MLDLEGVIDTVKRIIKEINMQAHADVFGSLTFEEFHIDYNNVVQFLRDYVIGDGRAFMDRSVLEDIYCIGEDFTFESVAEMNLCSGEYWLFSEDQEYEWYEDEFEYTPDTNGIVLDYLLSDNCTLQEFGACLYTALNFEGVSVSESLKTDLENLTEYKLAKASKMIV